MRHQRERGAQFSSQVTSLGAHVIFISLYTSISLQRFQALPQDHPLCACKFLERPYARVDRAKLKRKLLERCKSQGKPALFKSLGRALH